MFNNNNNNDGKGNIAHEERVTLLSFDPDLPITIVAVANHSHNKIMDPNVAQPDVPKDAEPAKGEEGEEQAAVKEEPKDAAEEPKPAAEEQKLPVNESGTSDTSSSSEVVKIELTTELLDDDGSSQDLFRIYHNNSAFVQDQPRDLGLLPVDYPPIRMEPTLVIAAVNEFVPTSPSSPECCCRVNEPIQIVLGSDDGKGYQEASGCVYYNSELTGESYTYQGTVEWFGQSTSSSPINSNSFEFSLSYTSCEMGAGRSASSGMFYDSYLT
ncbi:MAG TPA: hypothetical protein PLD88_04015, partial [Candidatus Berkiella sp.]|nr:hypothetical protein [Candidatus Berkiella sp.]